MAFIHHIAKEVRYTIRCSICREYEASIFGGNIQQAGKQFKKEGWVIDNCDILCPNCNPTHIKK